MPCPTGSEHFTRYFIRVFAVCGSAANHFLKWSPVSEFGCRPFKPSRFGGMPLKMPHAFGSMVAVVWATSAGAAVDVVVVVSPVMGSVVVVVVIPVVGSVELDEVVVSPVNGSVELVLVYVIPVTGSVQVVEVTEAPVVGSIQLEVV